MNFYAYTIRRPPKTLTDREQEQILKASGQHRAGFRDHVIFSLALGTGLREHEILALDIGDVFDHDGKPLRRVELRVFKRCSAQPADQNVNLPEGLRAKLDKFYRWKKRNGESVAYDAPLFMSRKKNRLSTRQLREKFHLWQKRAGFDRRLGFHSLRHTACSNVYRRTKDLRLTQRFARHKSVLTTTIYTYPSDTEMLRALLDLPC